MMANAGPAALAMRYGLKGPAHSTVSACAAGAHAIGTALRMIRAGDADAAVTGGTEAGVTAARLRRLRRHGRHCPSPASRGRSTRAATAS